MNELIQMTAIPNLTPETIFMLLLALFLLFLGIRKEYEPLLLIPIAFGVFLANFPGGGMSSHDEGGLMYLVYKNLLKSGFIPPIIFMGVGAMTDFGPMLRNLRLALFGAAAQIGIFTVLIVAIQAGFTPKEAASLGIIGGADGPTAIFVTLKLAPHLLGAISMAAYSYMALVPVIIPLVVRLTTNKEELKINMKKQDKELGGSLKVSKRAKILFPIIVTIIAGLLVPSSITLLGMLMFGNLLKEVGVTVDRLADAAKNAIINFCTIFLGLSVGGTMTGDSFLNLKTIGIIVGGFCAFGISIAGGIYAAKVYNFFARRAGKKLVNPLIGATGLSAVPMASRVANEIALENDPHNNILQYCMASNVAGVIGSAVAAGVLISFLG